MAQPKKKFRQNQNPPKKTPSAFSGNHQRSWLWGHHAVLETLQSGLWPVLEIYASRDAFNESVELLSAKQQAGIPVDIVTSDRLFELSKSTEHQAWSSDWDRIRIDRCRVSKANCDSLLLLTRTLHSRRVIPPLNPPRH